MSRSFAVLFVLCVSFGPAACEVVYDFRSPPEEVLRGDQDRIRGFKNASDSDFILGGIFAVHSPLAGSAGGRCSSDVIRSGAERTEAFLYAIDLINSDPNLLPNITLGYDVRDTCVSENIALDEVVELLFTENSDDTCNNQLMAAAGSGMYNESNRPSSVVAVIGPTTSQVSLSVASLLRLFTTPEVSYSVSSPTFNNRDRYSYFYRTHPSDSQEVQAMIDLAVEFEWTYVTTIHSNNAYGEPAIDTFRQLAGEKGICIDLDIGLDDNFTPEEYQAIAQEVLTESNASVVVFFASLSYVEQFMEHFSIVKGSISSNRNFVWVGSSSWAGAISITNNYPDIIAGMWGFEAFTKTESNFSDYFSRLTLNSNKRNAWFGEYFEEYFNCTKGETCNDDLPAVNHADYAQRNYIQLVIDAVYSVAHALNDFLLVNCDKPIKWNSNTQSCQGQKTQLNGTVLRQYLQDVDFTSPSGNRIIFDQQGSVEGQYKIFNFQKSNDSFEFVKVGQWSDLGDQFILSLFNNTPNQFGINQTNGEPLISFDSQCQQCPLGYIRIEVQSSCCGTCAICAGQEYANTTMDTTCSTCPEGTWGNNPLGGSHYCKEIRESYLDPTDGFGTLLIIVALLGLVCVAVVGIAMGVLWKTPVIKSSGREQMMLLLIGIALSFLVTVFFVVRPSLAVCLLQRLFAWFCFSLILSALFIKLIRIARIFIRSQVSKRPRFIQSKYQVVFTFILVALQMVLVIISLVVVYPEAVATISLDNQNTLDTPTMNIQCSSPHIAVLVIQILVYSALLVATNILAVMTIQFPENFNEARYVAFATFSTLLIWVAFLQTYFAVESSYRIAVICFAIQLTSLVVLFCLFVPRIFITLVWPKKRHDPVSPDRVIPLTTKTTSPSAKPFKDSSNDTIGNTKQLKHDSTFL